MDLVVFTRPDGSSVAINTAEIVHFAPVPAAGSSSAGPLGAGTRISFRNKTHQDVVEAFDQVQSKLEVRP